jgi:hypothetical protein
MLLWCVLACRGERAAGDNRDDDDSAGAAAATPGLHVVADAPAARFQAAQQLMRARDKVDRAAATALRQQMRAERKARLKALVQVGVWKEEGLGGVLAAVAAEGWGWWGAVRTCISDSRPGAPAIDALCMSY